MAHEKVALQVCGGEPLDIEWQQRHDRDGRADDESRDETQRTLMVQGSAEAPVQAREARAQTRLRAGAHPKKMAPNEDRHDDHEADGVLRLDEHAQYRQRHGGLAPTVGQREQGGEHQQRANRVDLAPQRGVVPTDGQEEE